MTSSKKRFGEVLVEAGLLKTDDLPRVLQEQRGKRGERIGETVVRMGLASEVDIARALSDQLGIPFIDLTAMSISASALQEVPERLAKKHQILPVAVLQKELHLAMADPLKFEALQDVRFTSNCTIVPLLATVTDIKKGIQHYYQKEKGDTIDTLVKDMAGDQPIEVLQEGAEFEGKDDDDLRRRSEAAPIIRMVNLIVSQAVETGASDIHIEPGKSMLLIRNRVDGLLRQSLEAPKWVQGPVTSRIKVMAQDGHCREAPAPGRASRDQGRAEVLRPPRLDDAGVARREGRHPRPRLDQSDGTYRVDGIRPGGARAHSGADQPASGHRPRDRSDRAPARPARSTAC